MNTLANPFFFFLYSYLVVVGSALGNVGRINVETRTYSTLYNDAKFPQYVSVDEYNDVVYWVNFDEGDNRLKLFKTYYSGITSELNISYPQNTEVRITQDMLHLYLLDGNNNRIDKYLKSSLEKVNSIETLSGANGIIAAFGK